MSIYSNLPNVYDTGTSGVLNNMRYCDHLPIFTIRLKSKSIINDTYRRKKNYSMKNISKFKKLLNANKWEEVYSHEDAQSAFTYYDIRDQRNRVMRKWLRVLSMDNSFLTKKIFLHSMNQ